MKRTLLFFSLILTISVFTPIVHACEIEFEVIGNKKDFYSVGDEIIVKIEVVFTHRVCPEGLEATNFKYEGLRILGATKWTEITSGTYERKLKIRIEKSDAGEISLTAIRTCDKDGGMGNIKLFVI